MENKVDVLLGAQWGDEGKGIWILRLPGPYSAIVRYQGGANAGHTLEIEIDGKIVKFVCHLLPSGIAHPTAELLIGNNVVFCPIQFEKEVKEAEALGLKISDRLKLSRIANLRTPYHGVLDACSEHFKKKKVGTTLRGIGPAYRDATSRNGLKLWMLLEDNFEDYFQTQEKLWKSEIEMYVRDHKFPFGKRKQKKLDFELKQWRESLEFVKKFPILDMNQYVQKLLRKGNILAEAAQGTMLDIDFGDYPNCTSSTTTGHGVFTGLGIGPNQIGEIYGVLKPFPTKVGGGEFPTGITQKRVEKKFQKLGNEFGSTTGRPRMVGWPDLVTLRYFIETHRGFGKVKLLFSKADIMPEGLAVIPVVSKYVYKDRTRGNTLKFPLSNISRVENLECTAWRIPLHTREYSKEVFENFNHFISLIKSELSDLSKYFEVYGIGTGPEVKDFVLYPKK